MKTIALMKEIEENTQKTAHVHGLEEQCCKMCILSTDLQVQCNPHKNPNDIFHRARKNTTKICMEPQQTPNSQSDFEQKEQARGVGMWFGRLRRCLQSRNPI